MKAATSDLELLLCRLANGDQTAADEIVRLYSRPLRTVIHRLLRGRVRTVFDSADIAQQVWLSFFGRELYLDQLEDPAHLLEFLKGMARHKAQRAARDCSRQKRDQRREVQLDEIDERELPACDQRCVEESAEREEEWSRFLEHLPADQRAVMTLMRKRLTLREIAHELGCTIRTVSRVIERIRKAK